MNRKLSYDGKKLHEMTQEELKDKVETNQKNELFAIIYLLQQLQE